MKRFVAFLLFVSATMLGCAQNYFNIPAENFAEKVKVLGIAPVFMDADSDITHPQKDLLIPLITDLNRKHEPLLVRQLQNTGNFYAVTPLADEPRQLFSTLMARREKRDDANIQYNKYFWKKDEIGAYIKKNRLDAVMVVVVSGLTNNSKIYSTNLLTSLETDFNFLTMTAQILGVDGTVLWEYPNFRGRMFTYYPLVNLQYPDFSESEANLSRKTEVRFKSLDGIRRTLEQKKSDWLLRETQEPEVYGRLFGEMTSFIRHAGEKKVKGIAVDETTQSHQDQPMKPANNRDKPEMNGYVAAPSAGSAVPVGETPVPAPAAIKVVETPIAPGITPKEAVLTTESPR